MEDQFIRYEIPIYGGELWVVFADDFVAWAKANGIELKWSGNDCNGLAMRKDDNQVGVYIMLIKHGKVRPDTIAHEALHITNYIFGDKGVEVSTGNDEYSCYLMDWIVEKAFAATYQLKEPITLKVDDYNFTPLLYTETITSFV